MLQYRVDERFHRFSGRRCWGSKGLVFKRFDYYFTRFEFSFAFLKTLKSKKPKKSKLCFKWKWWQITAAPGSWWNGATLKRSLIKSISSKKIISIETNSRKFENFIENISAFQFWDLRENFVLIICLSRSFYNLNSSKKNSILADSYTITRASLTQWINEKGDASKPKEEEKIDKVIGRITSVEHRLDKMLELLENLTTEATSRSRS